jgi:dTDP-4-dehydrorhamnose reductase
MWLTNWETSIGLSRIERLAGPGWTLRVVRVLITGAAGLLGSAVAVDASARGHDVVALERAQLDVTDSESVMQVIRSERPEVVIHCAAYTSVDRAEAEPELAFDVNRDGARYVAHAATEVGAVPVYISTDYVFDGQKGAPYRPDDATGPLSVYGCTKLAGEEATADSAPEHLVVRTSWLYGEDNGFVPAILHRAEAGEGLRVVDDQEGRPTWAPLAGAAVLDLVEKGARGVWHVAGGGTCTWLDLARETLRQTGLDNPVAPVSTNEFGAPAPRPSYSVLDLTATEHLLDRPMTDWRESLSRFLESRDG